MTISPSPAVVVRIEVNMSAHEWWAWNHADQR